MKALYLRETGTVTNSEMRPIMLETRINIIRLNKGIKGQAQLILNPASNYKTPLNVRRTTHIN